MYSGVMLSFKDEEIDLCLCSVVDHLCPKCENLNRGSCWRLILHKGLMLDKDLN